jgi:hypothetical protein
MNAANRDSTRRATGMPAMIAARIVGDHHTQLAGRQRIIPPLN